MDESRKHFEEWVIGLYGYVQVIRKVNGTQEYSLSEIDKMWKSWEKSREEFIKGLRIDGCFYNYGDLEMRCILNSQEINGIKKSLGDDHDV